jgi:DNA-binding transcriptional MocR family regulator
MTSQQFRQIRRERAQRRALMLERLAERVAALCLVAIPVAGFFIVWGLL